MTATTSKLGADMLTDEQILEIAINAGIKSTATNEGRIAFARAILARQPAAIGKEPVAEVVMEPFDTWPRLKFVSVESMRNVEAGDMLYAAPLDKEASKPAAKNCQTGWADICHMAKHDGVVCPDDSCDIDDGTRAAPSVEQDERGALDVSVLARLSAQIFDCPLNPTISKFARAVEAHARAASTSANVAQGAEAVAWREEAQKLFTRCKLWPEKSDDGFMALLELRNHVEKLLKNGALTAAQSASGADHAN